MAYAGISPATQDAMTQDINALTIGGATMITWGGTVLGSTREGTGVVFNWNPVDKLIITSQHPGTPLGKRQLGEAITVTFEAIESTLQNIKRFWDLRASATNSRLSLGKRNTVATTDTLDWFCEGHLHRTRHWTLYRVSLEVDGDVNVADPNEFCTWRVIARAYPDLNLAQNAWYGEINDSPPV